MGVPIRQRAINELAEQDQRTCQLGCGICHLKSPAHAGDCDRVAARIDTIKATSRRDG